MSIPNFSRLIVYDYKTKIKFIRCRNYSFMMSTKIKLLGVDNFKFRRKVYAV